VPVFQNLPLDSAAEARGIPRGELQLRWCSPCGFGFNAAFDPELCRYGARYVNAQTHSPQFQAHVERLARQLIETRGVRDCRVVEVGCGQGDFLARLVRDPADGNVGVGFDPAYAGPDGASDGRLSFQRRYFDADAGVDADVVVCRHVIEHVPRPVEFLQSIAAAMSAGRGRRLFLETPALEWILEHQVVWDLFYEHCSLFTAEGLMTALHRAGFSSVQVSRVFGEQYLWAEAELQHPGCSAVAGVPGATSRLTAQAAEFGAQAARQVQAWTFAIERLAARGPVAVWGAGAKGVTFCHLTDPDATRLSGVIDINPGKQGKYVPGTGHRVFAPAEWVDRSSGSVLVLNPNYFDEIRTSLRTLRSQIEPVNLMELEFAA
jgi:SAM-dependent methyltransferase